MFIDAHFHAWQLDRGDYGWLTPALKPIYRNVTVADWQCQAELHGVTGGVLVQAAPTEPETHYLLALAAQNPCVLGVVGWVDLLAADAPARISQLTDKIKLKGLRPMLHDLSDPAWMLQSALAPAMQAMADCGLVFDALVKPQHLPLLLTFCKRYPDLQVVIDHGAKPDIAGNQWQLWANGLARIALETSAVCKLSGLMTQAGTSPVPGAALRWGQYIVNAFGPERVLWGSDWPVLELAGSYAQWWQETGTILQGLSPAHQAAVLGGNAQRVYRL